MWFEGDREAREKKTKNWKIEILREKKFRIGNEHTVRDVSFDWPGRYARTVGKPLAGLLPTAGRRDRNSFFTKFSKYFPKSSKFEF